VGVPARLLGVVRAVAMTGRGSRVATVCGVLVACCLSAPVVSAAHAQRGPEQDGGRGSLSISGRDGDRGGGLTVYARLRERAISLSWRGMYNFTPRSPRLCGVQLGEELNHAVGLSPVFYGRPSGLRLRLDQAGRFAWKGSRALRGDGRPRGLRERIVIRGRRTPQRVVRLTFSLRVGICTKVFRMRLSPGPLPDPPARPEPTTPATVFTDERLAADFFEQLDVRRDGSGHWEVSWSLDRQSCPAGAGIYHEVPFGDHIEFAVGAARRRARSVWRRTARERTGASLSAR
jgi:hypothetical protein